MVAVILLLLDRLQHLAGLELGEHHDRRRPCSSVGTKNAAPACDSGVQMRKRGRSGHSHSASWICVIVAHRRVRAHHALGLAGGAAGVGDRRRCGPGPGRRRPTASADTWPPRRSGRPRRRRAPSRHRAERQHLLEPGDLSSRPAARSTNIGFGSMISVVTPASSRTYAWSSSEPRGCSAVRR